MSEYVRLLVEVVLAIGAGGLVSLLTIKQQKRKQLSEANKTEAEADTALADAYSRRAATQVTLIEPYERSVERLQDQLDEAHDEIDLLNTYIELLADAMRQAGIRVPARPRQADPSPTARARRGRQRRRDSDLT